VEPEPEPELNSRGEKITVNSNNSAKVDSSGIHNFKHVRWYVTYLTELDVMIERRRRALNLNSSSFLENITVVSGMKHDVRRDSSSPLCLYSLSIDERIQSMVRLRVR
jgi:hypothetical protein